MTAAVVSIGRTRVPPALPADWPGKLTRRLRQRLATFDRKIAEFRERSRP